MPSPFESSSLILPVPGSPNSSSVTLIREEVTQRLGRAGTQTLCPLETDLSVTGHSQRLWYCSEEVAHRILCLSYITQNLHGRRDLCSIIVWIR